MNAPRSFTNGGNPTRRSVLSERAGWPSTTDEPQAGYAAQRGLGSLLPAAAPQPSLLDPLTRLRVLAKAAVAGAKLRLSAEEQEDGITPVTRLYKVECYGPEIGAAVVCGQGHSPEAATEGLRAKWAAARRAHAIAQLVTECERMAGEAFTPAARAELQTELSACRYADFAGKAARWRKAAHRHQQAA